MSWSFFTCIGFGGVIVPAGAPGFGGWPGAGAAPAAGAGCPGFGGTAGAAPAAGAGCPGFGGTAGAAVVVVPAGAATLAAGICSLIFLRLKGLGILGALMLAPPNATAPAPVAPADISNMLLSILSACSNVKPGGSATVSW